MRPTSSSPRNAHRRIERHFRKAISKDPYLKQLYSVPEFLLAREQIEDLLNRYYMLGLVESFVLTRSILYPKHDRYQTDPKMAEIYAQLGPNAEHYKYLLFLSKIMTDLEYNVIELALKRFK